MKTIILPGYSPRNKDWALAVASKLKVDHEIRPVLWDHWDDPDKRFDPIEKAEDIIDIAKNEKMNIIAKSIGTLVACHLILKVRNQIDKVILCGIPGGIFAENKNIYDQALKSFPHQKAIILQNQADPFGTYTETVNNLKGINPKIKVVSMPASTHDYPYSEQFNKFLL